MSLWKRFLTCGTLLFLVGLSACIKKDRTPPAMEISLFTGIGELARLNDSETDVRTHAKDKGLTIEEINPATRPPAMQDLKMEHLFFLSEVGVRIYFRQGHVVLIEVQEPFRGRVVGRTLQLFPFQLPKNTGADENWESNLVREFGQPRVAVSGGRLSSQGLFYNWGDISFNGLGPNEIAIYREKDIAQYREHNFGRVLTIFSHP